MPKPIISRRQFMKKLGLATVVSLTAITNFNGVEANNQPQKRMRTYCHAVSGFRAFPDPFKTNNQGAGIIVMGNAYQHHTFCEAVDLQEQLQAFPSPENYQLKNK